MNFFEKVASQPALVDRIQAQVRGLTFESSILIRKLNKHAESPRKQAIYLAEWLAWGQQPLPEVAKNLARSSGLVGDRRRKRVGYPHKDGTIHYFAVRTAE